MDSSTNKTKTNWDDGNSRNGDGCSSTCGVEVGWTCFGGTKTKPDQCFTVWGDNAKTPNEEWDDGNIVPLDGWSDLCKVEDGFICNDVPTSTLPYTHWVDIWGDGRVFKGTECDDKNLNNRDGWSSTCHIETGYYWINGSPTSKSTWSEIWGDGLNFGKYEWDDGDLLNNNGWDSNWLFEKCYQCVGGSPTGKDTCSLYKIKTTVERSSNSEIIVKFDDSVNVGLINSTDISISITADYSVTNLWSAKFIDSKNLVISFSIPTVLTGSEVMTIKLLEWKKFRGKYGGWIDPEVIQIKLKGISIFEHKFIFN